MNRDEFRKRKFSLRSISDKSWNYWWEGRLDLASKDQLKEYIQLLLDDVTELREEMIGTLTDDEIRAMVKVKYGWIGTANGEIARIIFEIVCSIRNRILIPESQKVRLLREKLDHTERKAEYLTKKLEKEELEKEANKYKDIYNRICLIHREDVRKRKEVRQFRLANFSIAELENELARKRKIEKVDDKHIIG